jgi:kynurenine formamidase
VNASRGPSEAEWLSYFETLSNRGRWGEDDTRGTLNFVTPEKARAAAGGSVTGQIVPLGRTIEFGDRVPAAEAPIPPLHFMYRTGQSAPSSGGYGSMDWLALPLHGLYVTHLDSHAHIFWNGETYNGQSAANVTAEAGARRGSILPAASGLVTRGVLLDIPRLHGVDALPLGSSVTREELEAAAERQGVTVEVGDVVAVRTGYTRIRSDISWAPPTPRDPRQQDQPRSGLCASTLPWVHEHSVAIVGTDTGTDAYPVPYSFLSPVHAVALCAMGLWILDNLDLEALGDLCESLGRWDFAFVLAPLKIKNATSSPVNPLALF